MAKKYPRSEDVSYQNQDSFYVMNNSAKSKSIANEAIDTYSGRVYSSSRYSRMGFDPSGVGGNGISGRYGLTNEGYESWRPEERSRFDDVRYTILYSDMCYKKHGLVRNVIDLMSDFASQGIRLVHPNPRIQRFYQQWFRKVCGQERSERFLNNLYRLGNVVVRVKTAKLKNKQAQEMYKVGAAADMEVEEYKVNKKEIPWQYVFLHPATVEISGGALANFVGNKTYELKLPLGLSKIIRSPKNDAERKVVSQLPSEIREAAKTTNKIVLPPEKTKVYHYKKDDWESWADPMISSILIDVSIYEKLKLADRAALDGAISNIRIFKLGSLEHKIAPGPAAIAKLASILESNVEAGTLDLIWGPDIELIESKTAVHQFLGKDKYEPTLIAIYAGLGIPPTLTGTFGAAGTTNNFISLKTLTNRLQYGRNMLIEFWTEQIKQVQKAMGFRLPATIEFDIMNLGEESSDKALLIQLADRNLISDEMLQRHFGHDPEMEKIRITRENKERDKGKMVPKAGAFHDPMFMESLKKAFVQTGVVTPSEVGIELLPKKEGEKTSMEMRQPAPGVTGPKPGSKTKPTGGRPRNSKDTTKRKTKTFKPKVKALELWLDEAQDKISEVLTPVFLEELNKASLRNLTSDEVKVFEDIKFGVLSNLKEFSEIDNNTLSSALNTPVEAGWHETYAAWSSEITEQLGRKITLDERKKIQSSIYILMNKEVSNGNDQSGG